MVNIDELCMNTIRMLSADAVQKAGSGHPGMPMGDADIVYILWSRFLKHNPKNPRWHNRDRFVLSAGHGSMLLYSLLYLTGYNITLNDIKNFRQLKSKTPGHPEYDLETGVEVSSGPLGLGFGIGVGMAIAQRYLSDIFNRPGFKIVDYNIYGLLSDGDIMEGVASEAASIAGHLKLGKIVYIYSDNKTTIDGSTDLTFTEDVGKRFEAYNWYVEHVDGYDHPAIEKAIKKAKMENNRPSLIIARTHLGFGSPNKQDVPDIHGAPLGEEELKLTKENLGWPQKKFHVPKEVLKCCRKAIAEGKKYESNWNELFRRYGEKYPDLIEKWKAFECGTSNKEWKKKMPFFNVESGDIATRSASSNVLNLIADDLPQLIGGSADLSPSNLTYLKKYPSLTPNNGGRNIHFGVREHSMGTILSGMALSNMLIPYGGTYLVFSEFMVPAIRITALMKNHVIYVLTHDSIGVGEDGPSHHPGPHLTVLRVIPNLTVIRPADANETVIAWEIALERNTGPITLVLTRQRVPIIDRKKYASHEGLRNGAYIIADSKKTPEIILIATGSEVNLALSAYEQLKRRGISVRVVSMPSFELFEEQSDEYKESVFPKKIEKRLAIETGSSLCWYKYVGLNGKVIGIDRFGLSAPANVLFKEFGFTVENIVKTAREILK